MKGYFAIVRRELLAYFFSPLAYLILTTFLLVFGYFFHVILAVLSDPRSPSGDFFPLLLNNVFTWFLLLLYCSTLTMRLLAEERKSGSIESLMTAPVSDATVVLGKFTGAFLFYLILWSPTLVYLWTMSLFSDLDPGPIAAGYLGIVLVGAYFLAIGTFASSLVKNQVAAAIVAFSILLVVFSIGMFGGLSSDPGWKNVWSYLTLWDHLDELGKGIVDTRRLAYFLSGTAFFLWLTTRSLEVRKWR